MKLEKQKIMFVCTRKFYSNLLVLLHLGLPAHHGVIGGPLIQGGHRRGDLLGCPGRPRLRLDLRGGGTGAFVLRPRRYGCDAKMASLFIYEKKIIIAFNYV